MAKNDYLESDLIFGRTWDDIQGIQHGGSSGRKVNTNIAGDYGASPVGDGTFRMVPSGDIVDFEERQRRLNRTE